MGKKIGILLSQGKMTCCLLVVFTIAQKVLKMKINDFVKLSVMRSENPGKNRNQLNQTKHTTRKPLETLESLCLSVALGTEPVCLHFMPKARATLKEL